MNTKNGFISQQKLFRIFCLPEIFYKDIGSLINEYFFAEDGQVGIKDAIYKKILSFSKRTKIRISQLYMRIRFSGALVHNQKSLICEYFPAPCIEITGRKYIMAFGSCMVLEGKKILSPFFAGRNNHIDLATFRPL